MDVGDFLSVSVDDDIQRFNIIELDDTSVSSYIAYRLMRTEGIHILYVKKGYVIPDKILNIKEHIIFSEDEIKGCDYYFKVNKSYVLPL